MYLYQTQVTDIPQLIPRRELCEYILLFSLERAAILFFLSPLHYESFMLYDQGNINHVASPPHRSV